MSGDWVVFRAKIGTIAKRYHGVGIGRIAAIFPENTRTFKALIRDYIDFTRPVPPRSETGEAYETPSNGLKKLRDHHLEQLSVRQISGVDFDNIVRDGFPNDPMIDGIVSDIAKASLEEPPAKFSPVPLTDSRPIIEQVISRAFRDWTNRKKCLVAYDTKCAITGATLAFRSGDTLCQACHIRPVSDGGPDAIENLILLSPDAHAAWDAGLLTLDIDFKVLRSPQLRSHEIVSAKEYQGYARVPKEPHLRPGSSFLTWHRKNRFEALRTKSGDDA